MALRERRREWGRKGGGRGCGDSPHVGHSVAGGGEAVGDDGEDAGDLEDEGGGVGQGEEDQDQHRLVVLQGLAEKTR